MHFENFMGMPVTSQRHINNLERFSKRHFEPELNIYICSYILLQTIKDVSKHQVYGC